MASRPPFIMSMELETSGFHDVEILAKESSPPQFVIKGVRMMPTPGWKVQLDKVELDSSTFTMRLKLTDIAPTGPVIQVLTKTPFSLELGSLGRAKDGRYVLSFCGRRRPREKYTLLHTEVVKIVTQRPSPPK